jgi:hypothetical protein
METAQKCLFLVMKATLQVPDLLTHGTNVLGIAADLLGEALDFLGIANNTKSLLCDNALSVMLQLKQMLGISGHVCPTTVVMNLKDNAHLIHASLPLWVRSVLDRVQWDGRARSSSQVLRAQGSECHVSRILHSLIHVGPNSPHGPRAPVRKHGMGWDIDVDLIEPTVVLWGSALIASLHKGIPHQ